MKLYVVQDGDLSIEELKAEPMSEQDYCAAHKALVMPCHDVFIRYQGGILLVERLGIPAKGMLWPVGGRIKRGIDIEKSLRIKTLEECGLDLDNIEELGCARVFLKTDPFGHGRGTDDIAFVYSADGIGTLNLNRLHRNPAIVRAGQYAQIRMNLDPYVRDFMDMVKF